MSQVHPSVSSSPAAARAGRLSPPAVSVIIPTYNRADLLMASLRSVAAQTFTDYEVIVVDDGSSDGTRERVNGWPRPIRYLWQPNQGVSEARNHALRVTKSEFVAFLDSDDLWQPRFLEQTVGRLRECPDEVLVFTDFISTDPAGKPIRGHRKKPHSGDVTARLFASTFIHTSAVVMRAAIIRDAGGFDGRLTHNEDYDLWLRLSLRHRFGLIPEPLCRRRCHQNSLSRRGCSPEVLLRKADLLYHFYEEGGGKTKIPERLARRRLARLYYTAGKSFVRAGRSAEARQILRKSMSFRPTLKACLWRLRAGAGPAPADAPADAVRVTHGR
jgi:glycosyltransferase involved in cell wall biosynthesis